MVWLKALESHPDIIPPTQSGWQEDGNSLKPILLTLDPMPESFFKLISCSCTKQCSTLRCSCRKANMSCTGCCKCKGQCLNK